MTNKVLVVTGGSRGIGAAVAKLAGASGYLVAVGYNRDVSAAQRVAVEIGPGRAIAVQACVSEEQDILRLFDTAAREFGPVTALANCAGISGGLFRLQDTTAAAMREVFEINVIGSLLCAREAVRRMSTLRGGAGGAIVNITSQAAKIGGAGEWIHYAASKGAIDTFTRGLAREVATEGIRVNAVSPGLIDTDFHASAGAPGRVEKMRSMIPMQREGTAEEVAEAVLWLLSEKASYVTGTILEVAGGR